MRFVIILLMATMFIAPASADENPDWFYPTCKRDFAVADSFADECLKNARMQTRYFNGAPETHSYYFDPNNSPTSHFGMGCMVAVTGKIMYLGMYYTTRPRNWAVANTANLRYIDFQGNVGLTVDGEPVNFLAVRQFKTDKIPARHPVRAELTAKGRLGGQDTNCEFRAGTQESFIASPEETFSYSEERRPDKDIVKWCSTTSDYCVTGDYTIMTGRDEGSIFFGSLAKTTFIKDDGTFLAKADHVETMCDAEHYARRLHFPSLIYELCPGKAD